MATQRPSPVSDDSEEARAFLQTRVALFWKVMFFISLLSSGMGAVGAIAEPGVDFVVVLALTVQSGLFWWLCRRGNRSIRFSRFMEAGGLLLNLTGGGFMGRYLFAAFVRDHSLVTSEGWLMAEGYVSMLQLGGVALTLAIRAALIPSEPRRTILVTGVVGLPLLLISTILVPTAHRGLALRPVGSSAYPWLPGTAAMMWCFVIITCTVISWVIYGLRVEVREARRLGQYVLEQKIGEGGMGEVYRARHGMMRRPSALKLLRGDQAGEVALRRFAGSAVFNGTSLVEVCSQHIHQTPEPLSVRGVVVSAELEAIVLACLDKDPERRPQTAAELRRLLEACAIEPWDGATARSWWLEHQRVLEGDAARSAGEVRTLAVDGSPRSSTELAA